MTTKEKKTDDELLWDCVRDFAPRAFRKLGDVVSLDRSRSRFASSYGADIITLTSNTGKTAQLFLKDFKHAPPIRRDREIHVYRNLLCRSKLGTADCYSTVVDQSSEHYWLFLEYVTGLAIKHRDFDYWIEGARWLGRMQTYFEDRLDMIASDELLARHDARFYKSIAEAAVNAVRIKNLDWAPRIENIVERYETVLAEMAAAPQTLVHGDYKPIQVLINEKSGAIRTCPVDWEKCAYGSIYYDLATLTEGFDSGRLTVLIGAFLSTAPSQSSGYQMRDVQRGIDMFRLNALLNRLRMSDSGKFSNASVLQLIEQTERQAGLVMTGQVRQR